MPYRLSFERRTAGCAEIHWIVCDSVNIAVGGPVEPGGPFAPKLSYIQQMPIRYMRRHPEGSGRSRGRWVGLVASPLFIASVLFAVPIAALTFVLAWTLKELPLRTTTAYVEVSDGESSPAEPRLPAEL